jgi:hypothetical protein
MQIPSPPNDTPDKPDSYTKLFSDQTGPEASGRTFYLNVGILRYGTSDKIQGAAILLALFILIFYLIVLTFSIFGSITVFNQTIIEKTLSALWNGFWLALGVAFGRGVNNHTE